MIIKELQKTFEYKNGEIFWKTKVGNKKIGDKAGCTNSLGYEKVIFRKKEYLVHRIVFALHNGFMPKMLDHIDGNKTNNKIENLREATKKENGYNRKLNKNNKSGIKGINWHKNNNKWQVSINVDGKQKYLGCFKDIEIAKKVIELNRVEHHKNFARFA